MNGDLLLFFGLALVAVGAAVAMLVSRNAVYSALFLIINFATIAVFFLMLGAPFIAMAQVTVYAGAIMVLFLFVIMLLGAEQIQLPGRGGWQRPLAILLAVALVAETAVVIFGRGEVTQMLQPSASDYGNPQAIGMTLFSDFLLPFEVTSVLLLAAMVGVIVITKEDRKKPE
ncbi:MAG: NADH-quinone oxidoreductase subunit J [Anaerolineales bacterium]|nr:NADH-quinone oxidoreductase subunit J [Anaerolineales bacterium]MCW5855128.1 NADH-quinone oxidoreductase subunit J [Anaerolineales bacterium]